MSEESFLRFETAQHNLIAALDKHSADQILICCEELELAANDVRAKGFDGGFVFSKENIHAVEELNLAARYRIRFLHDMCRARLYGIASQNNQGSMDTYSKH